MKNKIKKLTFNQFKQLCFQQLHDFVVWSLKIEKLKKTDKEYKSRIKNLNKEFKAASSYDDIREVYGYWGFDETSIIEAITRLPQQGGVYLRIDK